MRCTGMNFVDVMLTEAPRDTTFIYVDKRPLPGGHWVDSYDFVRLHMRSALYGVVSEKLVVKIKTQMLEGQLVPKLKHIFNGF